MSDTAVNLFSSLGSSSRGFNAADYLETPMGQWVLQQIDYPFNGVDQTSDEVMQHWCDLGMEKTYFAGDDEVKEWSIFVPTDAKKGETYPVLFAMHMGGTNIFWAETMGFVEDAAKEGYIVVCPNWSSDGLTDEQQDAFEASGMAHYESYVFKTVFEKAKEIAPIDESRVYCAGFSGGGNACGYVAMDCPELIAGFSPATGAAIQTEGDDSLDKLAEYGAGMMMVYGNYDAEERWPIAGDLVEIGPVSTYQTPAERLAYVNSWIEACGAESKTTVIDDVESVVEAGGDSAQGEFGIEFDDTFDKEYEVQYSFGDLTNEDGQTVVRFMSIEDCPHFVSPEWASETYHFLSRFSRNTETGELVIEG